MGSFKLSSKSSTILKRLISQLPLLMWKPQKFTAVIQIITPNLDQLTQVLKTLHNTASCGQIILLQNILLKDNSIMSKLISMSHKIELYHMEKYNQLENINAKFSQIIYNSAKYNSILTLDDDVIIISDELKFGFSIWQENQDRIIGFPNRLHFWMEANMPDADGNMQKITRWAYTSKFHNDFSLILSGASFIHKSYLVNYSENSNAGGHIGESFELFGVLVIGTFILQENR